MNEAPPKPGEFFHCGPWCFMVREIVNGKVTYFGCHENGKHKKIETCTLREWTIRMKGVADAAKR